MGIIEKNQSDHMSEKKNIKPYTRYRCYNEDGNGMKKQENIYVSLQLDKNITSGELVISIQFDRNAPNFFTNKNTISWCPTNEELDFINEAFGVITKGKHQRQDRTDESEHQRSNSEELIREADEKEILDRVFEKKRPAFNQ
jgi:hypothetical protein